MGIPQFFKYVRTQHPYLLSQIDLTPHQAAAAAAASSSSRFPPCCPPPPPPPSCGELYLDFNCAVHRCARDVVDRLSKEIREAATAASSSSSSSSSSSLLALLLSPELPAETRRAALNDVVVAESFEYVVRLCAALRPTRLVYVAIDGVPPRAKMVQQRARRYISQWCRSQMARRREHQQLQHVQRMEGEEEEEGGAAVALPGDDVPSRAVGFGAAEENEEEEEEEASPPFSLAAWWLQPSSMSLQQRRGHGAVAGGGRGEDRRSLLGEVERRRREAEAEVAEALADLEALWDSNGITPGTPFMDALGARLAELPARLGEAAANPALDVVVSSSQEPREGEQKIFRWLRCRHDDDDALFADEAAARRGGRHRFVPRLLYGLDADLILLAALCPAPGIRILRPMDAADPSSGRGSTDDRYHLIDVEGFRERFVHARIGHPSGSYASMREFVTLMSLVGNDFVPGLACLRIADGAIDFLLQAYRHAVASAGPGRTEEQRLVSMIGEEGGRPVLRAGALAHVLERVASEEDRRLHAIDRAYYAACASYASGGLPYAPRGGGGAGAAAGRRGRGRGRGGGRGGHSSPAVVHRATRGGDIVTRPTDAIAAEELERFPLLNPFPDVIRPGTVGWRPRYYRHLFHVGSTRLVHDVCRAYVHGLQWSLAYHMQVDVDEGWYYPYAYAPTALDLANFLVVRGIEEKKRSAAGSPPSSAVEPYPTTLSPSAGGAQEGGGAYDEIEESRRRRFPPAPPPPPPSAADLYSPEMQLLMVLPPQSIERHVPCPRLRQLPNAVEQGCTHYYPTDFRVITYLKSFVSDCHPVLPDIDEGRIRDAVRASNAYAARDGVDGSNGGRGEEEEEGTTNAGGRRRGRGQGRRGGGRGRGRRRSSRTDAAR